MAKVKKEIVEAALIKFVYDIGNTMPKSLYKFILGGTLGLISITNNDKLKTTFNNFLNAFQDEDGLIDTSKLQCVYEQAFKASDGKIQIELFNKSDSLLSLFVKPVTLTITKQDFDKILNEINSTSTTTDISLQQSS